MSVSPPIGGLTLYPMTELSKDRAAAVRNVVGFAQVIQGRATLNVGLQFCPEKSQSQAARILAPRFN